MPRGVFPARAWRRHGAPRRLAVARAYPAALVDGFDPDDGAIAAARHAAAEAELNDRVRFEVRPSADVTAATPYDVVVVLEARDPTARETARRIASHDGAIALVDDAVVLIEKSPRVIRLPEEVP